MTRGRFVLTEEGKRKQSTISHARPTKHANSLTADSTDSLVVKFLPSKQMSRVRFPVSAILFLLRMRVAALGHSGKHERKLKIDGFDVFFFTVNFFEFQPCDRTLFSLTRLTTNLDMIP
jgi:hypothetical protein